MKIDEKNRITEFREKPGPVADISDWKMPANVQATVPSKEKVEKIMNSRDINKDGKLSKDEFKHLVKDICLQLFDKGSFN